MEKLNLYLNYVAGTIIALAVIGTFLLTYNFLSIKKEPLKVIKIEYHGVKTDSINELNKIEIKKIDTLLNEISNVSNKIMIRQKEQMDIKNTESYISKVYTAIIAIILTIAGFFGFKSVNEIKFQSVNEAKEQSKRTSKEVAEAIATKEFNNKFDKDYRAEVNAEATEAFSSIWKKDIESITRRIENLERNMNIDEPTIQDEDNTEVETTKNPFDNE